MNDDIRRCLIRLAIYGGGALILLWLAGALGLFHALHPLEPLRY